MSKGIISNFKENKKFKKGGERTLVPVRVVSVILDETHPLFEQYGAWDGLGTIFYRKLKDNERYEQNINNVDREFFEDHQRKHARPFFPHFKIYPLKGEIVTILSTVNKKTIFSKERIHYSNYYFPPMNMWNSPHHNSFPQYIKIEDSEQMQQGTKIEHDDGEKNAPVVQEEATGYSLGFKRTENGIPIRAGTGSSEVTPPLGNYFKEKSGIKSVLPYEGDHIIEGRFGQSIRFGSTTPFDESAPQGTQPNANPWSFYSLNNESTNAINNNEKITGSLGDPITIIRNGQSRKLDPETGWIPYIENINEDDSSIYLTSNHKVNIKVAGQTNPIKMPSFLVDLKNKAATKLDNTRDFLVNKWNDFEDNVNDKAIDFAESTGISEATEDYVAPPPTVEYEVTETKEPQSFDDEFSFYDEAKRAGQDDDDFEDHEVTYENTSISGTEYGASITEQEEDIPIDVNIEESSEYGGSSYPAGANPQWIQNYKDYNKLDGGSRDALKERLGVTQGNYPLKMVGLWGKQTITVNKPQPWETVKKNLGPKSARKNTLMIHTTATNRGLGAYQIPMMHLYDRPSDLDSSGKAFRGCPRLGGSRAGYHFIIDEKGLVTKLYDDDFTAYGATGWNNASIHVNWVGGRNWNPEQRPNAAQARVLMLIVVHYLDNRYPQMKIIGHNQAAGKECPWFHTEAYAAELGIGLNQIWTQDEKPMRIHRGKSYYQDTLNAYYSRGICLARLLGGEEIIDTEEYVPVDGVSS